MAAQSDGPGPRRVSNQRFWSSITTTATKMAITVGVAPVAPSANSPVAVPIAIPGSGQVVSARVHVVRSIDASERVLAPAGEIGSEDVGAVIDKLEALLSRPLESSPTLENGSDLSVRDDLRACYGSLANVDLDYALCQYLPTLPSVTPPTGTSGAGSSSSTAPPAGASGAAPSTTSPIRTRGEGWCSPSLTCGTSGRSRRRC